MKLFNKTICGKNFPDLAIRPKLKVKRSFIYLNNTFRNKAHHDISLVGKILTKKRSANLVKLFVIIWSFLSEAGSLNILGTS